MGVVGAERQDGEPVGVHLTIVWICVSKSFLAEVLVLVQNVSLKKKKNLCRLSTFCCIWTFCLVLLATLDGNTYHTQTVLAHFLLSPDQAKSEQGFFLWPIQEGKNGIKQDPPSRSDLRFNRLNHLFPLVAPLFFFLFSIVPSFFLFLHLRHRAADSKSCVRICSGGSHSPSFTLTPSRSVTPSLTLVSWYDCFPLT